MSRTLTTRLTHDPTLTGWIISSVHDRVIKACQCSAVSIISVRSIVELNHIRQLTCILLLLWSDIRIWFWRKVPNLYFTLIALNHTGWLLLVARVVQVSVLFYFLEHLFGACRLWTFLTTWWTNWGHLRPWCVPSFVNLSLPEWVNCGLELTIIFLILLLLFNHSHSVSWQCLFFYNTYALLFFGANFHLTVVHDRPYLTIVLTVIPMSVEGSVWDKLWLRIWAIESLNWINSHAIWEKSFDTVLMSNWLNLVALPSCWGHEL